MGAATHAIPRVSLIAVAAALAGVAVLVGVVVPFVQLPSSQVAAIRAAAQRPVPAGPRTLPDALRPFGYDLRDSGTTGGGTGTSPAPQGVAAGATETETRALLARAERAAAEGTLWRLRDVAAHVARQPSWFTVAAVARARRMRDTVTGAVVAALLVIGLVLVWSARPLPLVAPPLLAGAAWWCASLWLGLAQPTAANGVAMSAAPGLPAGSPALGAYLVLVGSTVWGVCAVAGCVTWWWRWRWCWRA